MSLLVLQSHAEQVAGYLRDQLKRGRWSGVMPGVLRLEKELGVNRNTLEAGMKILENEGVLLAQGMGKQRKINMRQMKKEKGLKIAILLHDRLDRERDFLIQLVHQLEHAGHTAFFTSHSMQELGGNVVKIKHMAKREKPDAWVVLAGPTHVLEWFVASEIPTFTIFGRRSRLPISGTGPDKVPAMEALVKQLVDLGHKRIVMLNNRGRRLPAPGRLERGFLAALEAHGLPTGPYNMPDWDETPQGFHDCLARLFQHTPPTALIADEAILFMAAMQFCVQSKLQIPFDVSLVCTDANPAFTYFSPPVTHIAWDGNPVVKQTVAWANDLALGRDKRKQMYTKATLVAGGTIGPASQTHCG